MHQIVVVPTQPLRRSFLAALALAAALALPMLAAQPEAPSTDGCRYAFPRVRAWQLEQAALAAPDTRLAGFQPTLLVPPMC